MMDDGTNQSEPVQPGFALGGEPAGVSSTGRWHASTVRRPDDLIGQDAMVRTVSNAFETSRILTGF
jgi:hypothetical protein